MLIPAAQAASPPSLPPMLSATAAALNGQDWAVSMRMGLLDEKEVESHRRNASEIAGGAGSDR
eukprot:2527485-Rhodomonas_salina.4